MRAPSLLGRTWKDQRCKMQGAVPAEPMHVRSMRRSMKVQLLLTQQVCEGQGTEEFSMCSDPFIAHFVTV